MAGGLLGSVLALWSSGALVALAVPARPPPGLPTPAWDSSPDVRVLSFAVALTFGTGILFGLAPALHGSTPDLHAVMTQDAAGAGDSRRGGRLRAALVGVQVAVCMALIVAAGLPLRGLHTTYTVDRHVDLHGPERRTAEALGPFEGVRVRAPVDESSI